MVIWFFAVNFNICHMEVRMVLVNKYNSLRFLSHFSDYVMIKGKESPVWSLPWDRKFLDWLLSKRNTYDGCGRLTDGWSTIHWMYDEIHADFPRQQVFIIQRLLTFISCICDKKLQPCFKIHALYIQSFLHQLQISYFY